MTALNEIWHSADSALWVAALERYWVFVRPENMALERSLDSLDLNRIALMKAREWYTFLHDEYFAWKYTAKNRLATTRAQLRKYQEDGNLSALDGIRQRLLTFDRDDVRLGLHAACEIQGLGVAGASGLLALMHPRYFATVDQFLVKALREVRDLPEAQALARMNPLSLRTRDGVVLINLLREKARSLNQVLMTTDWTPRKLDKILWTFGR